MSTKTLGETIKGERTADGYSLRTFAACVGLSASYLSDIENDRRVPSEEVMVEIAAHLSFDAGRLMAIAGRFSQRAERYLKRHPGAIELVELLAVYDLSDEVITRLKQEVWGLNKP